MDADFQRGLEAARERVRHYVKTGRPMRESTLRYIGGPLDGRVVPKPAGKFIAVEVIDPGHCKPRPNRCTVRRYIYVPETIDGETILRYSHEK